MTDDEVRGIVVQGARYLQAAQQDVDLNLQLTHYNYAVAYLDAATRYADAARIARLTGIDVARAMDMAQAGQNAVNIAYMQRLGIRIRVPFVGGSEFPVVRLLKTH